MSVYLNDLFHWVVQDEETEDGFTGQDKVVTDGDITDKFHCAECPGGDGSSSSWELHKQPVYQHKTVLSTWYVNRYSIPAATAHPPSPPPQTSFAPTSSPDAASC